MLRMSSPHDHEPTPKEIADICRKIQAEWSDRERKRRAGEGPPKWRVPKVKIALDEQRARGSREE
jgi:hypothetical protein